MTIYLQNFALLAADDLLSLSTYLTLPRLPNPLAGVPCVPSVRGHQTIWWERCGGLLGCGGWEEEGELLLLHCWSL